MQTRRRGLASPQVPFDGASAFFRRFVGAGSDEEDDGDDESDLNGLKLI